MRNPWRKKNPFMSMWLSASNSAANSARSQAAARARRAASAAASKGNRDWIDLWTLPYLAPPKASKRKRR